MPRGRQYEEAFKIETVKYISENNKPIPQVTRSWGEHKYFTWLAKEVWQTT